MKSMKAARLTEEAELKDFIDRLLQASPAAQTEVMVTEWDSALTRFANNGIHQNVAERDVSVRVRVVKDGKTGVASINQMNEAAAADVLKRAIAIADLFHSNPYHLARSHHTIKVFTAITGNTRRKNLALQFGSQQRCTLQSFDCIQQRNQTAAAHRNALPSCRQPRERSLLHRFNFSSQTRQALSPDLL